MKCKYKILMSIISLTLLTFICDRMIGYFFENEYNRIENGRPGKINRLLADRESEIMIFGSSRAAHHYVSSIIEDSLKKSCYNYGGDGEGTVFTCTKILSSIENHTPKMILIEASMDYLSGNFGKELSLFNHFYNENEIIKNILNESDRFMVVKQQFKAFRYNSTLTFLMKNTVSDKKNNNGYEPLYGKMGDEVELRNFELKSLFVDNYTRNKFELVLQKCLEKKIEIVLVISPMFSRIDTTTSKKSLHPLFEICRKYNIRFFDNSQLEGVFDNSSYYQDKSHLNDVGANSYTLKVIKDLKLLNIK